LLRWIERFTQEAGSFIEFTRSYKKFGLNINKDGDLEYREWAPSARELSIVGFI
jgi:1,4-alpha-glucan branching enzyme